MPSPSTMLTGLGALLMLHSAYSCLHYRSLLMDLDLQDAFAIPPADVYLEVGISFTILLLSQLMGAGSFQSVEIISGETRRPLKAPMYRTRDFDVYAHRCKPVVSKAKAS
jgi:hypothetical protein